VHAWLLSNTSSSRVFGSTSSRAWTACSKAVGAYLYKNAQEVHANGGKAEKGENLERTSAFAPRSPICAAAATLSVPSMWSLTTVSVHTEQQTPSPLKTI